VTFVDMATKKFVSFNVAKSQVHRAFIMGYMLVFAIAIQKIVLELER